MKKLLLLFFFLTDFTLSAQKDFAGANDLYAKGNYEAAAKAYEDILKTGVEAYELYYNLGNAYYKADNIPYAILNYERAKKLKPNDEDLLHNLQLANSKITDRLEAPGKLFYKEWYDNFINLFTEKGWSVTCILLLILSIALLAAYVTFQNPQFKRLAFWSAAVMLFLTVNTFFFARAQYKNIISSDEAIIISSSAVVKSSPTTAGTKLFILHEGTKVTVKETLQGQTKIELPGKKIGWIPSNSFVVI